MFVRAQEQLVRTAAGSADVCAWSGTVSGRGMGKGPVYRGLACTNQTASSSQITKRFAHLLCVCAPARLGNPEDTT